MVKDRAPDKITEAIRGVAEGEEGVDPDLAFSALNDVANPLTAREVVILRLAAQGAPAMEIADEPCLSVGTVRNYPSRAIGKTCARTGVDAIRIADGAGGFDPARIGRPDRGRVHICAVPPETCHQGAQSDETSRFVEIGGVACGFR